MPNPPQNHFKQLEDDILNELDNVDYVLDYEWKDGFRTGADQELERWILAIQEARHPKSPNLA